MDLGIKNKTAIVCASSRGLGKGCAVALAKEGVNIILNGVNPENLTKAKAQIAEYGTQVDCVLGKIENEETRNKIIELCPEPDILINNSGGPPAGDFYKWVEFDFIAAFNANFLSSVMLMQHYLPVMRRRGFGRIVNITSSMVKSPHIMLGLSTSARSGLHGISKALSREVAQDNITINNVLPERIQTDRINYLIKRQAKLSRQSFDQVKHDTEQTVAAKRLGTVEEFAGIVAFLCSNQAAYISGQSITVDGGNSSSVL